MPGRDGHCQFSPRVLAEMARHQSADKTGFGVLEIGVRTGKS